VSVDGRTTSYYGRAIVKEPVWKPSVPAYFWTGGIAGASAILSLWARLAGNEQLARRSLYVGAAFDLASPPLLISDLGRPERFLNMLRVFKVTSPMSVGSWILAFSGGASTTAALLEATGKLKRLKLVAETFSALTGAPLATYTGALIANTAVPAWQEARRELPFLFGASAAASAGAAAALVVPPAEAGPARRLAVLGSAAANTISLTMHRRIGFIGEPYRSGPAGRLGGLAMAATTAGAGVLGSRGRRSRAAAIAGASLLLAGELALRFSVFRAGFQSAADPRYTVTLQRRRLAARGR
jgi:formate-dependent nitrite reductase membrane component NrfD